MVLDAATDELLFAPARELRVLRRAPEQRRALRVAPDTTTALKTASHQAEVVAIFQAGGAATEYGVSLLAAADGSELVRAGFNSTSQRCFVDGAKS